LTIKIPANSQTNFKDLLLKATSILDKYDYSDFLWVKEYQESMLEYNETIIKNIADAIAIKFGVDPKSIHKSMKFSINLLKDISEEKHIKSGFFYKSTWDAIKRKLLKIMTKFNKFNITKSDKAIEPLKIKGKILNTKKALTDKEWREIFNILDIYLDDADLARIIIDNAMLFGILRQKMEAENIPIEIQKNMTWDEAKIKYWQELDSAKNTKQVIEKNEQTKKALEYARAKAGEYLSIDSGHLRNRIVNGVRKQITEGIQNQKEPQEVISSLYWEDYNLSGTLNQDSIEAINRDFRRIALTEFSYAMNEGYIATWKEKKGNKPLYFVHTISRGACEYCRNFNGTIVKYSEKSLDSDICTDKYAKYWIWSGKNNVGRRAKNYWLAIPLHPWCQCNYIQIDPDIEIYHKDYGKLLKEAKSFNTTNDLIKNDVFVANIEWDKNKELTIQKEIKTLIKKVRTLVPFKDKIIIHLYKNGENNQVGECGEGIINIYGNGGDWRDTFLHELGHQIYKFLELDKNMEIQKKLKIVVRNLKKQTKYNRIFDNKFIFFNESEIFATIFKWYVLGKFVNEIYLSILFQYCKQSQNIMNIILTKNIVKKTINLVFDLIKAKELPIGTKREWSGTTYEKKGNGKWLPVTKGKSKKEEEPLKQKKQDEFKPEKVKIETPEQYNALKNIKEEYKPKNTLTFAAPTQHMKRIDKALSPQGFQNNIKPIINISEVKTT
jgi:hypothetical protein